MNNKKHQKYIDEMMVVFGGEKPADSPVEEPIGTEPEYNAVDSFSDMANDMMQNFTSTLTGGSAGPTTHVAVVGDLDNSEQIDDDTGSDEVSQDNESAPTDVDEGEPAIPDQNQITFDLTDDGLVIKFADTELHLSNDAVSKLKSYLSGSESDTEKTDSNEDESSESEDEE